jgi:hypothetical protein
MHGDIGFRLCAHIGGGEYYLRLCSAVHVGHDYVLIHIGCAVDPDVMPWRQSNT